MFFPSPIKSNVIVTHAGPTLVGAFPSVFRDSCAGGVTPAGMKSSSCFARCCHGDSRRNLLASYIPSVCWPGGHYPVFFVSVDRCPGRDPGQFVNHSMFSFDRVHVCCSSKGLDFRMPLSRGCARNNRPVSKPDDYISVSPVECGTKSLLPRGSSALPETEPNTSAPALTCDVTFRPPGTPSRLAAPSGRGRSVLCRVQCLRDFLFTSWPGSAACSFFASSNQGIRENLPFLCLFCHLNWPFKALGFGVFSVVQADFRG
jgi:hypothetical protein